MSSAVITVPAPAQVAAPAAKRLTITLTDARPVTIREDHWPILSCSVWVDHDGQIECQANRQWKAWLKVRRHADGRAIVYGGYSYDTQWQGERDASYRDGIRLTETRPDMSDIIGAIREVGTTLGERSGSEHFADLIAECIADLPAEELS